MQAGNGFRSTSSVMQNSIFVVRQSDKSLAYVVKGQHLYDDALSSAHIYQVKDHLLLRGPVATVRVKLPYIRS